MQKHNPAVAGSQHMKLCRISMRIGIFVLCAVTAIFFLTSSSYAQDNPDSKSTQVTDQGEPESDISNQNEENQLDTEIVEAHDDDTGPITNLVNELPEIDLFVYADQSQSIFADPDGDGEKPAKKLVEMIRTAINSPISPLASRKVLDRGGRIFLYGFGDDLITNESPYDCSDDIRTFLDGEPAGSGEIEAGLQNYEGTSVENEITNLSCVFDHIKDNENINQALDDNRQPMILIASDFLHDPFNVSIMPVPPPNDFLIPEQGICDFLNGYYKSNQLPPPLTEALAGMDFLERGGSRRYIATLEMQLTEQDFSSKSAYSRCAIDSVGADRLAAGVISRALKAERFGFEDLDGNSFAERFTEQMLYAIAPPPVLDNVTLAQKLVSDTLDITFREASGLPATIRRLEFGSEETGWTQVSLNQAVELAGGQEQNYTQEIRLPDIQRSGPLNIRAVYTRQNGASELVSAVTAVDSQSLDRLDVIEFSIELDDSSASAFPVRIENPNSAAVRLAAIRVLTEAGDGEAEIRLPGSEAFLIGAQRTETYNLRDTTTLNRIRKAARRGLWVEIAADGLNILPGEYTRGNVAVRAPKIFCPVPADGFDGYNWIPVQNSETGASGYELQVQLRTEQPTGSNIAVDAIRIAGVADDISIPVNDRVPFTTVEGGSRANVRIPFLSEQLNSLKYGRSTLDITFLYNGTELCTVQEIPTAPDASEKFQIIDNSWNLRRDADTQNLILEFKVSHQNRLTDRRLDNIYLVATQLGDTYPRSRLNFELVNQETNLIPPGSDGAVTVLIDLDSAGIGEAELRDRGLLLISERFDSGDDVPPPIAIPERLLPQISIDSFNWLTEEAGVALTISSTYASSVESIVFSPIANEIREELVITTPLPSVLKLREDIQQDLQVSFNDGRGTLRRLSELQQSQEIFVCALRRGDTLGNCEGAWSRADNFPTIAVDRVVPRVNYEAQGQKLFIDVENNAPYPETTTGIQFTAPNGTTRTIDFPEPLVLPANGVAQVELNPTLEEHQFLVRGGQYSWEALLARSGLSQPTGGQLNNAVIRISEPDLSHPTVLSSFIDNRLPYYSFEVISELPTMSLKDYRLEAELLNEANVPLSGWTDSLIIKDSETGLIGEAITPFAASINEALINQNLSVRVNLYAPRQTTPIASSTSPIEVDPPFFQDAKDILHAAMVVFFAAALAVYALQFLVYPIVNTIPGTETSILTRFEYSISRMATPVLPSKEISDLKFIWMPFIIIVLAVVFFPWSFLFGGAGQFSAINVFKNLNYLSNGIGGFLPFLLRKFLKVRKTQDLKGEILRHEQNKLSDKLNINDNISSQTSQNILVLISIYLALFGIFFAISFYIFSEIFIVPSACEQPGDWLRLSQGGCNG